jgi:hypothetical protein
MTIPFGTNAKGYVVGAQLLWNVFDGINPLKMEKRRLISKAEIEIQQRRTKTQ